MNKLRSIYRLVAINLLNTILLLIIINLVLGVAFFIKGHRTKPKPVGLFNSDGSPVDNGKRFGGVLEWFDFDATKEVGEVAAADVLDDFYDLANNGFIYRPWTGFSEPPFAGKRVSVDLDAAGFPVRRTINPTANGTKRILNVFVFGGSTTFGYYVADEHTWPSYLAAALNERAKQQGLNIEVQVTNHGHATYFPSQETALCIEVLKSGQRPDLIIFMDGVNWGPNQDEPVFTQTVERRFNLLQRDDPVLARQQVRSWLRQWVPLYRFAAAVRQRTQPRYPVGIGPVDLNGNKVDAKKREHIEFIAERFRQSARLSNAVCETYQTPALFFLQPDALYNYPLSLIKRSPTGQNWQTNQEERRQFYEELATDSQFISLHQAFDEFGVQQGRKAVVNGVHYNPSFNKFLAEIVAARIDLAALAKTPVRTPQRATGLRHQPATDR